MPAEHRVQMMKQFLAGLTNEELSWVKGHINEEKDPGILNNTKPVPKKITVTYGTETGNSKSIATGLAIKARKEGVTVKLVSLDQYRLNDLTNEEFFFSIVSTHGDGEPPAAAKKFYDHIHNNGFTLNKLKYSVFALGDTSYPLFCKTGEDIDEQLSKLNGVRLLPLVKTDVEYDHDATQWTETVLQLLRSSTNVIVQPAIQAQPASKRKIYRGEILASINLNDRDSAIKTFHIELGTPGVEFEPGDSIGIVPENPEYLVHKILSITGIAAAKKLQYRTVEYTVYELLKSKVNIVYLPSSIIQKYAGLMNVTISSDRLDLTELLEIYPIKEEALFEQALNLLNTIPPRLYTIASSVIAQPDEVHLSVELDEYEYHGESRFGICSSFLGDKKISEGLNFFVQKNKRFRLPADDVAVIMVGPGTGIAAFRSFLYERESRGAEGKNWLFFGGRNFTTDFLYQTEIQNWAETGLLTQVNVAFSHDCQERVYVETKIIEHGEALYQWIEKGAHIYICGQKDPMSYKVERAFLQVIKDFGNKTLEEAKAYLEELKSTGRYSVDVY